MNFYHRLFSLVGVRQEQDIYVRLIDSVTKQVLYIHVSFNRISSIINLLSSQKMCNAIWYIYYNMKKLIQIFIFQICMILYRWLICQKQNKGEGKQIVFIIYGHKWYLYLILVLIAFLLLYFNWPSYLTKLRHNLQFYTPTDKVISISILPYNISK